MSSCVTSASNCELLADRSSDVRLGGEADGLLPQSLADDVRQPDKRAGADEQDVRRVDLDVLLFGVLAAALRGNVGHGAFEHLQQRLLDTLARDVAGDRDVLRGLADLVDLIDVDDSALGGFEVVVGGLEQLEQQVLDVLTDVAGLGQRGRVADGERHVERARQRVGQQRLAGPGRADHQHVGLVDLDRRVFFRRRQPLVVIVDGHAEGALGDLLADHVLVEELLELPGRGDRPDARPPGVNPAAFLLEDVLAQVGAVGTDVDIVGAFDHGADFP